MTSANLTILVAILSIGICAAALAYVFVGQAAMAKSRSAKRIQAIAAPEKTKRALFLSGNDTGKDRRKAVQDTLDELADRQKNKKQRVSLRMQIEQSGIKISVRKFWTASAGCAVGVAALLVFVGQGPIAILLGALIGFVGLPRWFLSMARTRRQKKFTNEFSNALDVIVRGVKSGLPLNECLKIIAKEAQEPVRSEFQIVVDGQKVGLPLDQSLQMLFERMPVPEINFFMIVLIIQQGSGGNLSEALGNLSEVLRTRKQMRAKIQAMSSEAKASAGIIGSLPPGVAGLVYMTSPDYIITLFTTETGHMLLGLSACWMTTGILIMRKMINFNF